MMQPHDRFSRWLECSKTARSDAAEKLAVSRSVITRWCNGDRCPTRKAARDIERLSDGAVPAATWGYVITGSKGERLIQTWLLAEGLSVNAAAQHIGVATVSLRRWACGGGIPSPPYIVLLSRLLKTKLTEADFQR